MISDKRVWDRGQNHDGECVGVEQTTDLDTQVAINRRIPALTLRSLRYSTHEVDHMSTVIGRLV